jgi:hypothetical protein
MKLFVEDTDLHRPDGRKNVAATEIVLSVTLRQRMKTKK